MAARVALAAVAVLILGWAAILLRNHELGEDAAVRAFFGPRPNAAERQRDLDRLESAQFLDPNAYWRIAEANYHLMSGANARAARASEELVRDEPENIFAWSTLLRATQRADPERALEAAAEIRRLNPLAARSTR